VSESSASRGRYQATSQTEEAWVGSLPRFCQALREAGDDGTLAARLLILTKSDALFERERHQRRRYEQNLAWLQKNSVNR